MLAGLVLPLDLFFFRLLLLLLVLLGMQIFLSFFFFLPSLVRAASFTGFLRVLSFLVALVFLLVGLVCFMYLLLLLFFLLVCLVAFFFLFFFLFFSGQILGLVAQILGVNPLQATLASESRFEHFCQQLPDLVTALQEALPDHPDVRSF